MKQVITYECESKPTTKEKVSALDIAREKDCIINLKWWLDYGKEWLEMQIFPTDTLGKIDGRGAILYKNKCEKGNTRYVLL